MGYIHSNMAIEIPANFGNMITDFATDLNHTFPEFTHILTPYTSRPMPADLEREVFEHVLRVYPARIFDILYQSETQFDATSTVCVDYLPNMDFKLLYHAEGVSATTRNAIWKYLQLVLVSIVGCIPNRNMFGDAASMFENVDEKVFQDKLSETIHGIGDFFKHLGDPTTTTTEDDANDDADIMGEAFNKVFEEMKQEHDRGQGNESADTHVPNAEGIHEHLKSLFDGKIGTLAKELAEEIAHDLEQMLGEDVKNMTNPQDLLKKLIKNPKRVMDIMKKIGAKLKEKMKNNEISEQDIMREAGEILGKMKGMTGKDGKDFGEIFKNLAKGMDGMGGLGGLGKAMFNTGAMNQFGRQMAQKERMQSKLERRRQETADEKQHLVFSVDGEEKQAKSSISQAPTALHEMSIDELATMIGENEPKPPKKKSSGKNKRK